MERWSDSLWFGSFRGADFGVQTMPLWDTVKFAFFDVNGNVRHSIKKINFRSIPNDQRAVILNKPNDAFYRYRNTWKYMLRENDTLFNIVDMKPVPEVRFSRK